MKVRLSNYNEKWSRMFEEESQVLRGILGKEIIRFEHFGSTSVPGLKAKPVIDMMCIVQDIHKIDHYNEYMSSIGYDVAGEWGIEGRRLFRKGGDHRTHHIHIYEQDNPQIERHLIFRDYLRAHPHEVLLYSNFKEKLAEQFVDTKDYSPAKKAFVSEMEQRAIIWFNQS